MPPSLPRSSLSSLNRCTCSSTTVSLPIRTFTSTTSRSAIGPESPKFIEIPTAPQQQASDRPVVKGALPVPRNIFRKRGIDKTSDEYFARATPLPVNQKPTSNDWIAYKRRLADTRRQSLREGLRALEKRKIKQDSEMKGRSRKKSELREKLVYAPQREDDRLTSPTVTAANSALNTGVLPDPNRAARVAEKAARVQARQKQLEEARRDALHTLYMNARGFIVTEEQLEAKVEEIFTATPHRPNDTNQNIWDVSAPPTVAAMLTSVTDQSSRAIEFGSGPTATTLKRYKRIAEELTGGKMDG